MTDPEAPCIFGIDYLRRGYFKDPKNGTSLGWWHMPNGSGYSNASTTTGSATANLSGLLHCRRILVENIVVKVWYVGALIPKSCAPEEHQNNQQVDQTAKIEMGKVDLDWQHKGELFLILWTHDTSGHKGGDATYRWAQIQGVKLMGGCYCTACPSV